VAPASNVSNDDRRLSLFLIVEITVSLLLDTRVCRLILAGMSREKTTFGLTLSNRAIVTRGIQPKDLIDMALRAEASGRLDAVWVGDSILSKPRLECMPLLGAIASHTTRLHLGVACMATIAQRNPVLLALQWSSLDVLSGGRTWLSACMGYPASQHPTAAKELAVMGIASKERPGRLEEMIQCLRVLWSNEHASFQGKYYSFDDVNLLPKPAQQPCPIYIAGTPRASNIGEDGVERSLRRIARYADGWMTNQIELPMLRDYLKRLREMLVEEGKDPDSFKTVLYYGISVNRDREQAFSETKAFLDSYYLKNFSREGVEIWNAFGPVEHCVRSIQNFMDAGVDHITIRPIGQNLDEQFRIYLEEILPALQ
jgi:alkanesulfonate monooxygenase SsuD/methylene tetrahydromethanopterin reductase-like flavin-dependent oxidoreductase (luciferase family)